MQISFSVRSTPLGLSFLVCYYFQYKCFGLSCGYCLLNSPWCSMWTECLFSELCPSCWHCEKTSTATRSWAKRQLSRLWWEGDGKVRINITSFSFNPRWIRTVRLQCYLSFHLYQMEDRPTQIREMFSLSLVVCWIHAHSHLSTLYVFPLAAVFFFSPSRCFACCQRMWEPKKERGRNIVAFNFEHLLLHFILFTFVCSISRTFSSWVCYICSFPTIHTNIFPFFHFGSTFCMYFSLPICATL